MATETSDEPAAPASPRRGRGTVLDMVRSLGVVLLLIGVVALITLRPHGGDEIRVVDYSGELAAARGAAPYDVLAPTGLDGFRATSVRYTSTDDGTIWHLGFVSPLDEYIGLDQTDGDADQLIDDLTEGATPVDGSQASVQLGSREWDRYDDGGDHDGERIRGLVSEAGGAATLVSGTADWPELEAMAAALSSSSSSSSAAATS